MVLSLFLPSHVTFVSIDPLLDFDVATLSPSLAARLTLAPCKSQDYCLSSVRPYAAAAVNVVVACHSHAPLQEFWDRLSTSSHPLRASAVDAAASTSADSGASVPGDIAADAVDTTAVPVSVILNSVAAVSCSSANASPALSVVEGHSDGSVRAAMRLCVSMPCCGKEWSLLPQLTPLAEYEDYEVFSARRRVFLYGDVAPTCKS